MSTACMLDLETLNGIFTDFTQNLSEYSSSFPVSVQIKFLNLGLVTKLTYNLNVISVGKRFMTLFRYIIPSTRTWGCCMEPGLLGGRWFYPGG